MEGTSQIAAAMSVPKESTNADKQVNAPIRIEGSGEGSSTNYALIALIIFVLVFLLSMLASCNGLNGNSSQIADIEKKYQDSLSLATRIEGGKNENRITKLSCRPKISEG